MANIPKDVVSVAPCMQITVMDCATAVVAMLTGHPYAEVSTHARKTAAKTRKSGADEVMLRRLAAGVGAKLHKIRAAEVDLDEDTGMLWLASTNNTIPAHLSMLFRGVLVDPGTGLLWNPHIFLQENPHYQVEALFTLA